MKFVGLRGVVGTLEVRGMTIVGELIGFLYPFFCGRL